MAGEGDKKKGKSAASGGGQPSASEEAAAKYPDMQLAQDIHRLRLCKDDASLQQQVLEKIVVELESPSLYRSLQKDIFDEMLPESLADETKLSEAALKAMEEKHEAHVTKLEEQVTTAKEQAGDSEVMEARIEVARFAAQCLSEAQAVQAYDDLLALPKLSSGKKIDLYMERARLASFYGHTAQVDVEIAAARKLADSGAADWDKKNRLKVYRGLQELLHRDIKAASGLLLDCIATFSCNEICTYQQFVVYAVMSNLLHLPRPQLKKKILDGPEILSVASDIPIVIKLVKSLYDCDYKAYLHNMVELEKVLLNDRYLQPHAAFWMRELHILAYQQFLDSYQSVTLDAMAAAFGVSVDFVDTHASRFIAAQRLSAKIDKYGGIIVTNRPDLKNAQYRDMIQKGDLLLNRIQKLARVVDL